MSEAPIVKKRGRPKKAVEPPMDAPVVIDTDEVDPSVRPNERIDGKANPAFFGWLLRKVRTAHFDSIERGEGGITNYKSTVDGIFAEARAAGLNLLDLTDNRTMIDRALACVERMKEIEKCTLMEDFDEELEAIEKVTDLVNADVYRYGFSKTVTDERTTEERDAAAEKVKEIEEVGKRWRDRIRRIRVLREGIRSPVPRKHILHPRNFASCDILPFLTPHALKAARVLRYMAYVMRTNLSDRQAEGGASSVLDFKIHHARMAWLTYLAQNGLDFDAKQIAQREAKIDGAIIAIPPGHGKTTYAAAFFTLWMSDNIYLKLLIGHAQESQAADNLKYLKTFFALDNPTGRRRAAVFGPVKIAQSSGTQFRISTKEKSRQPSARAHGMTAKISGADADAIWFDDPVDQAEREQDEERRRKYDTMNGTWLNRLRGRKTFHLTTTTIWHEDDANMRRIKAARAGKLNVDALIIRCGGPDTVPKFKPIWPELFPASMLKQKYMANASMYAAAYMCEPRPVDQQIIRKLRYYVPECDENAQFMRAAVFHVSVDPTATTRPGSDKAGLLYAACGDVLGMVDGQASRERRLRIIVAKEIRATQSDLAEMVSEWCANNSVDYVHVETVTGFAGFKEMLENQYKIDCIAHHPGIKNKETRLRGIGSMLEHDQFQKASYGAVIEFPGVLTPEGTPGPNPEYEWLYEQFLKFGSVSSDHIVDALSQLAAHLLRNGELHPGAGRITQMVRAVRDGTEKTRMQTYMEAWKRSNVQTEGRNVEQEDAEFMASR